MIPLDRQPKGVIAIITVLGVTVVVLGAFVTLTTLSTSQLAQGSAVADSEQTFFTAQAGINEGLFRLTKNPGAQTFTTTLNDATATVVISIDTTDVLQKRRIIRSSVDFRGKERVMQVVANTNAMASNIQYAVQSGSGGIVMAQNSEVRGNLYSNGTISGANGATIIGDAWSVGATGIVNRVTIGSNSPSTATAKCPNPPPDPAYNSHNLRSHTITNSSIFGRAYYQTVSGNVRAGANNDSCSEGENGPNCYDNSADPASTSYPFTQQQIDELKNIADDDTQTGNVTISSDTVLTARKIVGNLTVTGGTLTLNGPVYVTGTIDINHPNVTVRLPASLGEASGALITDQSIDIKNNALLMGSGDPKSFLVVIALRSDVTNWVIQGANNSTAVIYFAPDGLITVAQNAILNNTTGLKINLENNSCIQYNPNLIGFSIPGGDPVPISVQLGSWQEL